MSIYNDYVIGHLVEQQQAELHARAAEDRLARLVPRPLTPWWRRVLRGRPTRAAGATPTVPAFLLVTGDDRVR